MKLYFHPLSGHSHRARLFLSLIDVPHELVLVDLAKAEHKSPGFLALNSFGQIPVLDDGGTIVADSNAILVYLARKFGRNDWLPEDPEGAARVQRWLSIAAGPIAFGPAAARLVNVFKAPLDAEDAIRRANGILAQVDAELAKSHWLAADRPTVADVALYSYIARAPEGNVDLADHANIRSWLTRMEALPGFVEFARTPVGLAA